jgi:hypothetical protein
MTNSGLAVPDSMVLSYWCVTVGSFQYHRLYTASNDRMPDEPTNYKLVRSGRGLTEAQSRHLA